MERYKLPERHIYWNTETTGMFPAMNYGEIFFITPFEGILREVQLSNVDNHDNQVSKFVFKCLNGTNPIQFHNWFILNYDKYGHRTRSNFNTDGIIIKNLFVPSARTSNYGLKQK